MKSVKLKKYFIGKYISLITRSIRGTQKSHGDVFTGNHVIEGLYVDEDQEYIFLGDGDGDVVDAISKRDIVRVFINNPLDDGSEIPGSFN